MGDDDAPTEVNVCVAVRCRPMSGKEIAESSSVIVEFPAPSQVVLANKKERHQYAFDHVFGMDSIQESVYIALGQPLLDKAFEGYNATIFAYGQTGSGKTHTMMSHRQGPDDRGLIPRISFGLYDRINALTAEHETRRFLVTCSFLEIYNEIIFDLLVPRNKQAKGGLEVREQKGIGVYVKDLTERVVDAAEKLDTLIENGFEHRSTAATKMNEGSSRSHCIFIIKLHQKDAEDESKNTFSKINLVDLAGSERAKSTEAEGDRLKEGANINKSLSALGNVINALSSVAGGNKKIFVPYRNSKLTRVLQESLGGNSLCTMVAAISPSSTNFDETLSTLNYAKRAKTIKVSATKNDEASQIRKLEDEVEALRRKLAEQAGATEQVSMGNKEKQELESKYESQITELQSFMKQSWEEKQKLSEQHEEQQKKLAIESKKAAERLFIERRRRLQLLEQNGDIQLTLAALQEMNSPLAAGWTSKIADMIKLEQQLRSQLRAVKLFRESAKTDFAMCVGCKVNDVVAILTLLHQVHTKLRSMGTELATFGRLEMQIEERLGQITPEVALSIREANTNLPTDESEEAQNARKEAIELVTLIQRQLSEHHAKVRTFVQTERASLGLDEELRWLLQCLEEDGASPTAARQDLKKALRENVDGTAKNSNLETRLLGLSTFDLQDERLTASSNAAVARCARLQQTMLYGGWSPERDAPEEFLEIDLADETLVVGISMQGRLPCTSEWMQTRDLLQLALKDVAEKVPTSEKVFKRPPVRLIHDVGATLAHEGGCFAGVGDWVVPQELLNYGELTREQKVTFFETLVNSTNMAWAKAREGGLADLLITSQEILSGKNCEESNRLLQLLSYLRIFPAEGRDTNGLADAAPQWTKAWKLSYTKGAGGWRWYGSPDGMDPRAASVFEGNSDTSTVKFIKFPEPVAATKLRVHPVEWQNHVALRCEVHVATDTGGAPTNSSLDDCLGLACEGIVEVKRGIEERKQAKQREEEERAAETTALKEQAEQQRDILEQRLKDALASVDELRQANATNEAKAAEIETELLKMQVERDRLSSQVEQLSADVATSTEQKVVAEKQVADLKEECGELQSGVDDLTTQLQVMTEERDLARQKEEELFDMLAMKEEDLMDTNNGYCYLTERLQEKEEEMDRMQENMTELDTTNTKLEERSRELSDEVIRISGENKALKMRVAEEERSAKAAQDRYMKLLKDNMANTATTTSRPTSGHDSRLLTASTSPSENGRGPSRGGGGNTYFADDFEEDPKGET
mmetsp:Transcript_118387/g.334593  ORF Transcript_118387/g.334593 Transcript_118387/m.334593 type:complete len:1269 (+) Transcript_118387:131-3937(+)|eukprot:CAMPEP_0117475186 /NCGR_PEP_ID=MMETSP0784-20121206/9665_1 /TAXON_ID=39447 /ORGANISM="" /LENGTH=1268 /DNA_ID=CAMNT_0005269425 /DNA_START=120 /DNA_END=3926 /DNA_ORIENTATION=-